MFHGDLVFGGWDAGNLDVVGEEAGQGGRTLRLERVK